MRVTIPAELQPYLKRLAEIGVHGETPTQVAAFLLRQSIAGQLRDGLLLNWRQTGLWQARSRLERRSAFATTRRKHIQPIPHEQNVRVGPRSRRLSGDRRLP